MLFPIQKSFSTQNSSQCKKKLYIVPTPIGNLKEFSQRAIETLKLSQLLLCENKISCLKILSHFGIERKRIITYNSMSDKSEYLVSKIFKEMIKYENISILSCAGYPLVSDPGRTIVRRWIDEGFFVIPISGPSAFLNALVSSGFYFHNFVFLGFLSRSKHKQLKILNSYSKNFSSALIIYESPLRIIKTLENIFESLGNRMIAVCREITKMHEEIFRGSVERVIENLKNSKDSIRGEFVLIVSVEVSNKYEKNFVEKLLESKKSKLLYRNS